MHNRCNEIKSLIDKKSLADFISLIYLTDALIKSEKTISASESKEAKERFDKLYSTYLSIPDREYDNFKTQADFFKLSNRLKDTPSIDSIRLYLPIKENELFKAYEETKQNKIIKNNEEISL